MSKKKAKTYCRFGGCTCNNSLTEPKHFFRFPKDPKRCEAWIKACNNPKLEGISAEKLHSISYLCGDHFSDWCFMNVRDRNRLVHNAVPGASKPLSTSRQPALSTCETLIDVQVYSSETYPECESNAVVETAPSVSLPIRPNEAKAGSEMRKKWRYIKDAYRKSMTVNSSSGITGSNKKPYIYHKQMSFLLKTPHYQNFRTSANMDESQTEDASFPVNNISQLSLKEALQAIEVTSNNNTLCSNVTVIRTKRKAEDDNCRDVSNVPPAKQSTHNYLDPENPDRMFFLSLVPRVSALKSRAKLDFQIKVMQLLQEFETYDDD